MIKLYFWLTPEPSKITIALEEMDLPYEVERVDLTAGAQFIPSFLAISPSGKVPAIEDSDGPGGKQVSLFESGAILMYLARKSGRFYGGSELERIEIEQWLTWQVAALGPMSGQAMHFRHNARGKVEDEQLAYGAERYSGEVTRLYGVLERRLSSRDFVAGGYSIADMACWPWIRIHQMLGQSLEPFPWLEAWFQRIAERPAVTRAMAVGESVLPAAQRTMSAAEPKE